MQLHGNAALSLNKRRQLCRRVVDESWSLTRAAEAAEVSERTAGKWVARSRAEGELGLLDRSSAPRTVANRTPEDRVEAIAALRRLRFTGTQLAELFAMPETTVSGIVTRIGMGRLGRVGGAALEVNSRAPRTGSPSWRAGRVPRSWPRSSRAHVGLRVELRARIVPHAGSPVSLSRYCTTNTGSSSSSANRFDGCQLVGRPLALGVSLVARVVYESTVAVKLEPTIR